MKTLKSTLVIIALLANAFTYAQDEEVTTPATEETEAESTFAISGSIDTYYRSNFSEEQLTAPGTSFAQIPGFALGMANVVIGYEGEKSGFVADLVFGPRGTEAVFGSTGSSNIVNQLYAYYNLNDKVTLTLGNFNTFLGYEVISPVANFNYSTSYMFSYGPFSHTGVKADFALSDDFSLMLGVFNQTDYTEGNFYIDDNSNTVAFEEYMYGVQLGYKGQYLNLLAGGDYTQFDFTGGFDLSDDFFLGINATVADAADDAGFSGVALYPQYSFSDSFTFGVRGEIFSETEGFTGAFGSVSEADNTSITLTGSYTSGNFILKPEIRIDTASEEIFTISPSETADNLASFVIAAIYSF